MDESITRYRSISVWSIVAFVAAVFGLFSFAEIWCLVFTAGGLVAGGVALQQIPRYEHQGRWFAVCALIASGMILATSPFWHIWQYRMEAPEGYTRLNLGQLVSSSDHALDEYLGRKIFLKGYAYPQREPVVKQFALTATGNPNQQNAVIIVELDQQASVGHIQPAIGVAGVLENNPAADHNLKQPRYRLVDARVHPNRTNHDWSQRTHWAAWGDEVLVLR